MMSSAAQVSKLQRHHMIDYRHMTNSARRFRTLLRVERYQVVQCMRNQVRCSDDNTGPRTLESSARAWCASMSVSGWF